MVERTPVPTGIRPGITEPQLEFIHRLLDERDLTMSAKFVENYSSDNLKEAIADLKRRAADLTKSVASGWIDTLLDLPKKSSAVLEAGNRIRVRYVLIENEEGNIRRVGIVMLPDGREVPAGSYGLDTSNDDGRFVNDTSFFRVWVGDRYGWGVQLYVSDYTDRVKLTKPSQIWALEKIAMDLPGAAAMFGHEFKRCGICGRGLTNDESRRRGIGPICADRMGW